MNRSDDKMANDSADTGIQPETFLAATDYLDYHEPQVSAFAEKHLGNSRTDIQRAVSLYYGVRDDLRYDPYLIRTTPDTYRASYVIEQGAGYCIQKGLVYTAVCRYAGIPARPGYADVRNHVASQRLLDLLGTDLFVYHGYVEVWLNDKWVKATPAFNLSLCERFDMLPLDFDGLEDSLSHPYDTMGRKFMEYVTDHGTRKDVPVEEITQVMLQTYPNYFRQVKRGKFDFLSEAGKK